jgi:hypothetical protein
MRIEAEFLTMKVGKGACHWTSHRLRAWELPEAVKSPGASSLTPALSHAQRERVNRLAARGCLGAVARNAVAGGFGKESVTQVDAYAH